VLKKELIAIKDIFIRQGEEEEEEVEEGGGEEGEEVEGKQDGGRETTTDGAGRGQMKDKGDLSSQIHCSTPLCE